MLVTITTKLFPSQFVASSCQRQSQRNPLSYILPNDFNLLNTQPYIPDVQHVTSYYLKVRCSGDKRKRRKPLPLPSYSSSLLPHGNTRLVTPKLLAGKPRSTVMTLCQQQSWHIESQKLGAMICLHPRGDLRTVQCYS